MEIILLAVLFLGMLGWVLLGVEDNRFHNEWEPVRYQAAPEVLRWEDSLPHRRPLPWAQEATA